MVRTEGKITEFTQYRPPEPDITPTNPIVTVTDGVSEMQDGFLQSSGFKSGVSGWRLDGSGRASFTDITIANNLITVSVGQSIQDAINKISDSGGGTVQLDAGTYNLTSSITLPSGVSLVGSGKDITIIDFGNTSAKITSLSKSNFAIVSLTVQNSSSNGIYINSGDTFFIRNVKSFSHGGDGCLIEDSSNWIIDQSVFSYNTGNGLYINTTGAYETNANFQIVNSASKFNTTDGFVIEGEAGAVFGPYFCSGLNASGNTGRGFYIKQYASFGTFVGCVTGAGNVGGGVNGGDAFEIVGGENSFLGCSTITSGDRGFLVSGTLNVFLGCRGHISSLPGPVYENSADYNVFIGNTLSVSRDADAVLTLADSKVNSTGNINESSVTAKKVLRFKNTSGGALSEGNVVVLKSVASGFEVTTTTTAGLNKVVGMVMEAIADNSYGFVLVEGKTTKLKVDGTTDIAIGDFLSTYTVAGIAGKASAGHAVFAIALEAYTGNDSNGVIDALLIAPRLI